MAGAQLGMDAERADRALCSRVCANTSTRRALRRKVSRVRHTCTASQLMCSRTHCSPGWLQAPDRCEGHQRSTPSPRPPPPRTVPARPLPLRRSEPHRGRPREADRRKQQAAGVGERAWAAGADGRRSGGVRSPCMRHAAARRAGGRSVASRPTVGGHWEGMWGRYADSLVCARRGAVRHRGSGHTDYTVLAMQRASSACVVWCRCGV